MSYQSWRLSQVVRSLEDRSDKLERGVEKKSEVADGEIGALVLVTRAMIRILEKKGLLTQDELFEMLTEIDLEDGKADGQVTSRDKEGRRVHRRPL